MGTKYSFKSLNTNFTNFSKIYTNKNKTLTENVENENNFKYLKIICIRENEHFGGVLMFLNEKAFFQNVLKFYY